jgi:hypothetical protein
MRSRAMPDGDGDGELPAPEQIDTSLVPALRAKFGDVRFRALSGYLFGPFMPPGENVDSGFSRFVLYRGLSLNEYIEFEWHQVKWIEGHTVAGEGPKRKRKSQPEPSLVPQRVTVWIAEEAQIAVGGFLVGSIADHYLPPDEVQTQLIGNQKQLAALLAAGTVLGCSTNPQCNL